MIITIAVLQLLPPLVKEADETSSEPKSHAQNKIKKLKMRETAKIK